MIFGINTTSDISKWLYVISRAVRRVKFETILKYHEWYLCQILHTNHAITHTHKKNIWGEYFSWGEYFTCGYFKLSWNTTALSRSNCRNFSCSSIHAQTILDKKNDVIEIVVQFHCFSSYRNDLYRRNNYVSKQPVSSTAFIQYRYLHNFVKPSVTAVVFRTITMQRLACSNWAGWILHNTWRLSRVRWRLVKTQNKDSFFYCFKVGLVFTICD